MRREWQQCVSSGVCESSSGCKSSRGVGAAAAQLSPSSPLAHFPSSLLPRSTTCYCVIRSQSCSIARYRFLPPISLSPPLSPLLHVCERQCWQHFAAVHCARQAKPTRRSQAGMSGRNAHRLHLTSPHLTSHTALPTANCPPHCCVPLSRAVLSAGSASHTSTSVARSVHCGAEATGCEVSSAALTLTCTTTHCPRICRCHSVTAHPSLSRVLHLPPSPAAVCRGWPTSLTCPSCVSRLPASLLLFCVPRRCPLPGSDCCVALYCTVLCCVVSVSSVFAATAESPDACNEWFAAPPGARPTETRPETSTEQQNTVHTLSTHPHRLPCTRSHMPAATEGVGRVCLSSPCVSH